MTELHATLRHFGTLALIGLVATLGFFAFMHHVAPAPAPVNGPVAVFTPSPVEHEAQAVIDAFKAGAASTASRVSPLEQPAVTVVRDSGLVGGLSDAQIAQLLSALKPKTAEKVTVGTRVVGPSPSPTPTGALQQMIYGAAYSADTHALKDTTIKTDVHITRQEVAPSRIGSVIASGGAGISYAVLRRGQYEFDLGLLRPNNGSNLTGAAALIYNIPHTSLGLGPSVIYQHGTKFGISAVIHF